MVRNWIYYLIKNATLIFLSLLDTFTSKSLDKLKAPTVESLSSQRQIGNLITFEIFVAILFTE